MDYFICMNFSSLSRIRKPKQLIENRICFAGLDSELSIYDTYEAAKRVELKSDQLLYCGMVSGRKIMYQQEQPSGLDFLPHESFVMAPEQVVEIDFPGATQELPTTCLTVEIDKQKVTSISERLAPISSFQNHSDSWQKQDPFLHSHHNSETQFLLKRLVSIFIENHPDRDVMIDLSLEELIVRVLRQKECDFILQYSRKEPDANPISAVLNYIEQSLNQAIDIDYLCKLACMSRSRFFAEFKKHMGCTPSEFQQKLRLQKAAEMLTTGQSITHICFDLGFNNLSHFSRRFSQYYGYSPSQYRKAKQK